MVFFMTPKVTTAYILAGGQSRRMGRDKLLLPIGDRTLLEHTLATCREIFDNVKLVARETEKFAGFECDVLIDRDNVSGPMAGLLAALDDCRQDSFFVTAADLVDLSADLIRALLAAYDSQQYFGLGEKSGIQPLCGIYATSSRLILERMAAAGNFRMTEAVMQMQHGCLMAAPEQWRNLNRPEDFAELMEKHA